MSDKKADIIKLSDEDKLFKDGLENLIANLGTGEDKRTFSRFVNNKMLSANGGQIELNALYRTNWVAGKIVDIIPSDMTREWRQFTGDMEPETVLDLIAEEERLGLQEGFNDAHKWSRLYGTAFIIMCIDDGGKPWEPLNIDKIKPGGLKYINVIDRHRITQADTTIQDNPLLPNFGLPDFYRINNTSVKIHHSRVLRFDGVKLPYDELRKNNYNSDSVLDRLYDPITNLTTVTDGSASMVYESNVDIIKIKGMMTYLASTEGEELLRKRFTLSKIMKSFNNSLILDSEESFESKTNAFSGLPDLLDRYNLIVTAGGDVPATRLLGSSASGLNATGEGDLKNYYDKIRSDQNVHYRPRLNYFDKIMGKSLGLSDDTDLTFIFNPLFQMTPKEIADTNLVNAQTDQIYLDNDVITEEIVAKELLQKKTYTNIDNTWIKELEELAKLEKLEGEEDDDFDTSTEEVEGSENEGEEEG